MKMTCLTIFVAAFFLTTGVAMSETNEELKSQVQAAETAFAKTMADRDLKGFATFLAAEAVFFSDQQVLRGKKAITTGWSPYFADPAAPFSWTSAEVEVLESGVLAHSSGPVFAPDGKQIGTFNSVWRCEGNGSWKVVFDKGCPHCPE